MIINAGAKQHFLFFLDVKSDLTVNYVLKSVEVSDFLNQKMVEKLDDCHAIITCSANLL